MINSKNYPTKNTKIETNYSDQTQTRLETALNDYDSKLMNAKTQGRFFIKRFENNQKQSEIIHRGKRPCEITEFSPKNKEELLVKERDFNKTFNV